MSDSASIGINRGLLTFSGEGNNVRSSPYFSRMIHYPAQGISGVTIGRGYDMGKRLPGQIICDLTRTGVSQSQAQALSMAAGLRGNRAAEFVRQNRATIGEITEQQQAALFNQIYPGYERQARSAYYARTTNVQGRPE